MIKGLYEAHLPVSDLEQSIDFYQKLGLEIAWRNNSSAFFWIVKKESWLGLWEGEEYKTSYHPSLKHIAFTIDYEDMKNALAWLENKRVSIVPFGNRKSIEPFVRPYQGNASVYFEDPDKNSLEFMCYVDVPSHLKDVNDKLSILEWEELLEK
ncbi:VOC family protein [Alkalicoccus daliensis]|uniref:Glyoxalase-like domain-containing protein n=1 Tax=Alkalicoccus daliensis TaxID=745820 RepID=A0A1H0JXI8_9BACI|nr:VOC family protein [Alkalicoccus daliensis]SDO48367.1 Glyoxalase-like domain-containing protein [Alkalicoccus daliensis]